MQLTMIGIREISQNVPTNVKIIIYIISAVVVAGIFIFEKKGERHEK